MKEILKLTIAGLLFLNSIAWADGAGRGYANTKVSPAMVVDSFKRFKSTEDIYAAMKIANPEKAPGANWIEFYKRNKIDISKNDFKNVTIDGEKVYVPGVKAPFIFMGDQKTIKYKEIPFTFDLTQTPEQNFSRIKIIWGGFKELGLAETNATASKIKIFLPDANAEVTKRDVSWFAIVTTMAVGVAVGMSLPLAIGFGAVAYVSMGLYDIIKSNAVELNCEKPPFRFVIKKTGEDVTDKTFEKLSADEKKKSIENWTNICKSPSEAAQFNKNISRIQGRVAVGKENPFTTLLKDAKPATATQTIPTSAPAGIKQ